MSWTEITRIKYRRDGLRYASDTTDEEWALIEPHMPAKFRVGRPRETRMRAVLDAIFYIIETGCQWRMLPKDFPPFTTVQGYFYQWRDDGRWELINHHLLMQAREVAGRAASPSAGVIDSQSVEATEAGGPAVRRRQEDQGPQASHPTDTSGLLVGAVVHAADIAGSRLRTLVFLRRRSRANHPPVVLTDGFDPMAAMRARNSSNRSCHSASGRSRSSSGRTLPRASCCCLAAGSSSGPSPGSTATAGSPRTSRNQSPPPWRGS